MAKNTRNSKGLVGFEAILWQAADKMRGNMDPAEYKHVVLGLIFLKYISDSFEQKREDLEVELANEGISGKDLEDELEERDYYAAENVFWVPSEARWQELQRNSKKPEIGALVDNAMDAIERENVSLKGVLPKIYARRELDKRVLGEVFDLIGDIGLGDKESKSKDILGRVYEYFIGKFAQQEGKGGGEFFTPGSIVKLLVEMIQPFKGRVFDPCCGSGGMFVQSERFVKAHGGRTGDISIYGQESNPTTWKLAKMNLAIRGFETNLGGTYADSFHNDLHKSLKADYILANPPFNDSDWGGDLLREDMRWKFGSPPSSNANYAWIQHFVHHLSPTGIAGFVLANNSVSTDKKAEAIIRTNLVRNNLIDCIITLPRQLFLTTLSPATIWIVSKRKKNDEHRANKTLFIDCRRFGRMIDRKNRVLTQEDIDVISTLYHNWVNQQNYQDAPGLNRVVDSKEIEKKKYDLNPGRYVGVSDELIDDHSSVSRIKEICDVLEKDFQSYDEMRENIIRLIQRIRENNLFSFSDYSWKVHSLGDLCSEIFTGSTPPVEIREYVEEGGISFIRSQNVFDYYIDYANIARLSKESVVSIERSKLEKHDVLLDITGDGITFLRCSKIKEDVLPAFVNQSIAVIRLENKRLSNYVSYYLNQNFMKYYMEGFNSGSARRTLAAKHVKEFKIIIPNPIEKAYEINDKLEELFDFIAFIDNQKNSIRELSSLLIPVLFRTNFHEVKSVLKRF